MQTTKIIRRLAGFAAIGLMAGCVSRPTTFVASSIPVDQNNYTVLGKAVSGSDCQISIAFMSFGAPGSNQRNALDDALNQIPGANALVGMAVEHEVFEVIPCLLPVFGIYKTRVTGVPVKTFDK